MTTIRTARLELLALSPDELRLLADDADKLKRKLHMQMNSEMLTDAGREAIQAKLGRLATADAPSSEWITYWLMTTQETRQGVGLVGFEGSPDDQGQVKIGYVMDPDRRQQGYMSEAVRQLIDWAFNHPQCTAIIAPKISANDLAANRLFQNVGALVGPEVDGCLSYRLDRADWQRGVTDHYQPHSRENPSKRSDMGQKWEIASALSDGPKSRQELVDHLLAYVRFAGLFSLADRLGRPQQQADFYRVVDTSLDAMINDGWITREGSRYALTEEGLAASARPLADLRRTGELVRRAAQPSTAAKVSLFLHLCLAAVKIPAGLVSGSVGLLNDGLDTLVDGLSSLLVLLGLRLNKERAANIALVILMLFTAGFTLFEAVRNLFAPREAAGDALAFGAALLSALLYGLLSLYQRAVGQRSGSMALIAQAVDSRNHVIVAISVTAALIASLSGLPIIDTVVGLAVALLILKSAIELAIELARSLAGQETTPGEGRDLLARLEQYRRDQLAEWMLYLVQRGQVSDVADLSERASQALDMSSNPSLRALGVGQSPEQTDQRIEAALHKIADESWLTMTPELALTDRGQAHLRQAHSNRSHHHEDLTASWSTHLRASDSRPGRGLGRDGVGPGRGRRHQHHDPH